MRWIRRCTRAADGFDRRYNVERRARILPIRELMGALLIDWRTALIYVTRERAWTRRVGLGGALMLVVPPIGWVLALGYRSLVGNRLVDGRVPLLPDWRGHTAIAFSRGLASAGVILAYLSPFLITYWLVGVRDLALLTAHGREVAVFVGAVLLFPPAAVPGMPLLYAIRYEWLHFTAAEIATLAFLFFAGIITLPAAFLQVAHHRRFRAALNPAAALRLIATVPRLYAEAWVVSLAVSAVAVLVVPLAPWLLFWSYLVISHVFLQVLGAATRGEAVSG